MTLVAVRSRATHEHVAATAAVEQVVAAEATDDLGVGCAEELVVAVVAEDVALGRLERAAAVRSCDDTVGLGLACSLALRGVLGWGASRDGPGLAGCSRCGCRLNRWREGRGLGRLVLGQDLGGRWGYGRRGFGRRNFGRRGIGRWGVCLRRLRPRRLSRRRQPGDRRRGGDRQRRGRWGIDRRWRRRDRLDRGIRKRSSGQRECRGPHEQPDHAREKWTRLSSRRSGLGGQVASPHLIEEVQNPNYSFAQNVSIDLIDGGDVAREPVQSGVS